MTVKERAKLTSVEIAGICGKFQRPENQKEGLHLLAETGAEAQLAKALSLLIEEIKKVEMTDTEIVNAFADYAENTGLFPKERAVTQAHTQKIIGRLGE